MWSHCDLYESTLRIAGLPEVITRFKDQAKSRSAVHMADGELVVPILDLDSLVPIPTDLLHDQPMLSEEDKEKLRREYGHDNAMDWICHNWGSRNARNAYLKRESANELCYTFWTKWSPPVLWMDRVSGLFPDLHLDMWYIGETVSFSGFAAAWQGDGYVFGEVEYLPCYNGFGVWLSIPCLNMNCRKVVRPRRYRLLTTSIVEMLEKRDGIHPNTVENLSSSFEAEWERYLRYPALEFERTA